MDAFMEWVRPFASWEGLVIIITLVISLCPGATRRLRWLCGFVLLATSMWCFFGAVMGTVKFASAWFAHIAEEANRLSHAPQQALGQGIHAAEQGAKNLGGMLSEGLRRLAGGQEPSHLPTPDTAPAVPSPTLTPGNWPSPDDFFIISYLRLMLVSGILAWARFFWEVWRLIPED